MILLNFAGVNDERMASEWCEMKANQKLKTN